MPKIKKIINKINKLIQKRQEKNKGTKYGREEWKTFKHIKQDDIFNYFNNIKHKEISLSWKDAPIYAFINRFTLQRHK